MTSFCSHAEGGYFLRIQQRHGITGFAGFLRDPKPYTSYVDKIVDIVDKYMGSYLFFCG